MTLEEKDEMIYFLKHIKAILPDNKAIDNMTDEQLQLLWDECHDIEDTKIKECLVDRDIFIILKDIHKIYKTETKLRYDIVSTYLAHYPQASYMYITRMVYPDTSCNERSTAKRQEQKAKYEDVIEHKRTYVYTVLSDMSKKYFWLQNLMDKQSQLYFKGGNSKSL